jgi:hypothetical protein
VTAAGFAAYGQDVDVRGTVPIDLKVKLALAGERQSVTVEASAADLLENVPYAHNDMDTKTLDKLPISSPGSGLSDAVMLGSGAVAADSNGFFHPLRSRADQLLHRRDRSSTEQRILYRFRSTRFNP